MTDRPTEPYYFEEDDLPPPPPDWGQVVIRDQTAPRMAAAQTLVNQLNEIPEDRRGRFPSGQVRAVVGQAAGTIEALEDQAERVPGLLDEIEGLKAQLAHSEGGTDEQALRLWRAGKLAEVQEASERMYASARRHAEEMLTDARNYCAEIVAEAEQRAQSVDPTFPPAPELPEDRIARAVVVARYLDSVRSWLREKDAEVDGDLEALRMELEEASRLRRPLGAPHEG